MGAWFGSSRGFDAAALEAATFDPRSAPGVRLALGEPGSGLDGFRRSHEEAAQARRVASLAGRPPGAITRYRQVALRALATADLPRAREFVQRELGPLAADDDVSLRLAGTLRAYLDEQASRSRAAKRLGIHENTVSYRVRQAEELLGRRVDERTPRAARRPRARRCRAGRRGRRLSHTAVAPAQPAHSRLAQTALVRHLPRP